MQAELVLFIARMMNHSAQGYSLATVKGSIIQNIAETIIRDLLGNDLHTHNIINKDNFQTEKFIFN